MRSHLILDGFSRTARDLRNHFEKTFQDPTRDPTGSRFIWDYWNLPEQYTFLRTPAQHFFPKKIFERFYHELVLFGREHLGCHDITPPWLSCYVDGCEQKLHGDLPHGPWAYVFSLTPNGFKINFGGRTYLLKDQILSYWSGVDQFQGLEEGDLFHRIQPKFNRLLVFDPRVPHGVERVKGIQNVIQGRLVIHGWFANPRPFIQGSLTGTQLMNAIEIMSAEFQKIQGVKIHGLLSLRFSVLRSGKVSKLKLLGNSLRSDHAGFEGEIVKSVIGFWSHYKFAKQIRESTVTLPIQFRP